MSAAVARKEEMEMAEHPIPDAALAHHIAILGKTGSGKTVLAKGLAERILARGERFCAIDPTGAWWGLRLLADGVTASPFKVVLFGGRYPDAPLARKSGPALARIIGQGNVPAVIDTSMMTVSDRTEFFIEFAEALFRENDAALHLFLDEAHLFAPQGRVNDPQSGKMVHAANNLVSGGRSRGFRITMISQRAAKLHKDSLTQVETLVAMRLIAPQDRAAVEAWIGEWGGKAEGQKLLASLPSLPRGEGWVWSPEIELLTRAKFPMLTTYDSSAAPEPGVARHAPRALEESEIAELRSLLDEGTGTPAKKKRGKDINSPDIDVDIDAIEKAAFARGFAEGETSGLAKGRAQGLAQAAAAVEALNETSYSAIADAPIDRSIRTKSAPVSLNPPPPIKTIREVVIRDGARVVAAQNVAGMKLLSALARYPDEPLTWIDVCVASGMMHGNGYFYGGRKHLIDNDLVEDRDGAARITSKGRAAAGATKKTPTRAEIIALWQDRKQPGPRMLDVLSAAYPNWVSTEELSAETSIKPGNGFWYGGIAALRAAHLIEEDRSRGLRLSTFIGEHT